MLKNLVISERARNVAIAVALALFAGMLTLFYVSNYKRHVREAEANVKVLVATANIPAGTPGADAVKRSLVEPREVAQKSLTPGSFSTPAQIKGLVATDAIYAGEQVTASRLKPANQRGVRADLKGTLRAVQVAGDPNQLLAGTLKAGDHVDVVASIKYKVVTGGDELDRVATRVILRDLLVLRTATAGAGSGVGATDAKFVQLALSDSQSQKLFFAMKNGDWTLALRPPVRSADSPESVEVVETILGDGLRPRQFDQLAGRGTIR